MSYVAAGKTGNPHRAAGSFTTTGRKCNSVDSKRGHGRHKGSGPINRREGSVRRHFQPKKYGRSNREKSLEIQIDDAQTLLSVASPSFMSRKNPTIRSTVSDEGVVTLLSAPGLFFPLKSQSEPDDSTSRNCPLIITSITDSKINDWKPSFDPGQMDMHLKFATQLPLPSSPPPGPEIGPGPGAGPRPGPGPGPGPGLSKKPPLLGNAGKDFIALPPTHSPENFDKEWGKIKRLRSEVWSLRSKIHEMRGILREKQLVKSKLDDKFLQYVRKRAAGGNSFRTKDEQNTLEALLWDCEVARNEYGPLEDDCNLLESDLGTQEYVLQKLESKVYEMPINRPGSQPESEEVNAQPPLRLSSNYTESEVSQQFHPLVTEFLSILGDVDIYRERLDWHLDEKENLEEEKARRLRVGRELAPPDQQWLDNYTIAESELLTQLKEAEVEADRLRVECFSRGLIDEDSQPTNFENREKQTFSTDNVYSNDETSEYIKFPALIPPPGGKQISLGQTGPQDQQTVDETTSINPRLRVDQWILHQLRMSVLDVKLLANTFELEHGNITDEAQWQDDVLAKWFADSEEKLDVGPRTFSSGLFTQAPPAFQSASSSLSGKDGTLHWNLPYTSSGAAKSTSSILQHYDPFPTPYPEPIEKSI